MTCPIVVLQETNCQYVIYSKQLVGRGYVTKYIPLIGTYVNKRVNLILVILFEGWMIFLDVNCFFSAFLLIKYYFSSWARKGLSYFMNIKLQTKVVFCKPQIQRQPLGRG